jgi:hypothetical protein
MRLRLDAEGRTLLQLSKVDGLLEVCFRAKADAEIFTKTDDIG